MDNSITAFFDVDTDSAPIKHLHVKLTDEHSIEGECERRLVDPVMYYMRFFPSSVDVGIPRKWKLDWYVKVRGTYEMYPVDALLKRWKINKDKLMKKMITGEYEVYTLKSDGMTYKPLVVINTEIAEGALIAPLITE